MKLVNQSVNSSVIKMVSYDNNMLAVTFNTGKVYVYNGVTDKVVEKFMSAPSKGRFFVQNIRNNYVLMKVS